MTEPFTEEKPRILPLTVPARKGSGTERVQSTGPKTLLRSVSAIVWFLPSCVSGSASEGGSTSIFEVSTFHWLFDFKAIYIPSQSVLKIGFLTKNGTGITHFLLHSHLMLLRCHTSGWRSVLQ